MNNSRRQQVQAELGMNLEREDEKREKILEKEHERHAAKEAKREALMGTLSYRVMDKTTKFMDKWFLDPIINFLLPGDIGNLTSDILTIPFLYFAIAKVRSIPLTLALLCNMLIDTLIGAVPFLVGDILDIFSRSYVKNMKLITGFVNDDKKVVEEVNKKAVWSAILIVILCVLIYFMVKLAIWCGQWIASFVESLF